MSSLTALLVLLCLATLMASPGYRGGHGGTSYQGGRGHGGYGGGHGGGYGGGYGGYVGGYGGGYGGGHGGYGKRSAEAGYGHGYSSYGGHTGGYRPSHGPH